MSKGDTTENNFLKLLYNATAWANVADNAAALAGAEHDYDALDLAIATYEQLLSTAEQREQRDALDTAIRTLRAWKF